MLSLLMTTEYAPAEDRHELQQLILRVAGGEREALAELYQRTRSAVYGLALSYLKNAQDAQDLRHGRLADDDHRRWQPLCAQYPAAEQPAAQPGEPGEQPGQRQ